MELLILCLTLTGLIFIIVFYFAIMIFISYGIKQIISNNNLSALISLIFIFLYVAGGIYLFINLTDLKYLI